MVKRCVVPRSFPHSVIARPVRRLAVAIRTPVLSASLLREVASPQAMTEGVRPPRAGTGDTSGGNMRKHTRRGYAKAA